MTTGGKLSLQDGTATYSVSVKAQDTALAADLTFTLPAVDGSSGQILSTDGAGVLGWVTATSYQSGTATVAVSGTKTTFPSISISYTKVGNMVTVTMESKGAGWVTTKNNNGGFVVAGIIPSNLRANDVMSFPFQQNRNGIIGLGQCRVMSSGDIEFYRDHAFNDFIDNDTWMIQNRQSFSYNVTSP